MSKAELENLVSIGQLKAEPTSMKEFTGLVASAEARLADARKPDLAAESQFDLAYNASHAFALAALRLAGYRSQNRFTVFQALAHTTDIDAVAIRVLSKSHSERNLLEYGGGQTIDERLLADLLDATQKLREAVARLRK